MDAEAPIDTLQSPMSPDPQPDMTEIRRVFARNDPKKRQLPQQPDTNANNEEGGDVSKADEKDSEEPTVYMAWTHPVKDTEAQFIIDTGCLGSHIFKGTELFTRVHKSNVPVRDFSGIAHTTNLRGYLFHTNQQVLVMPDSKVNFVKLRTNLSRWISDKCNVQW